MNTPQTTGALLDPRDPRDIKIGSIRATASSKQPDSYHLDFSKIPVLNQMHQPACVGFTRAQILSYFIIKETGKTNFISESFCYALSKLYDGVPNEQGTYPRVMAQKNIDIGAMLKADFDRSPTLSIDAYKALNLTSKMAVQAAINKIKAYGTVLQTENSFVQALLDYGPIEITLPCDGYWSASPFKNINPVLGHHRIIITGYERREDDTYFFIRNSWGTSWNNKGNACFKWKDFAGQIYDPYIFSDMPEKDIQVIKEIPLTLSHSWNTLLKVGSKGVDVRMLQFALKLEGCLDLFANVDGSFGPITRNAVILFQKKYGLDQVGIVGPASRKILNSHYKNQNTVVTGALDKWAFAIQEHEGYFPPGTRGFPHGSLSWRNKNPGNIRFAGKYAKMAIGKHHLNFCIFKDYETGFKALKILLTDAATGKSSLYKPSMSLLQFFSVYAPASDNNSPSTYALAVAKRIGVTVDTPINQLIH